MKLFVALGLAAAAGCTTTDRTFLSNVYAEHTYLVLEYEHLCRGPKAGPSTCKLKQVALNELERQFNIAQVVVTKGALPKAERAQIAKAVKEARK